eukprot:TRINITY_DN3216_c1_g3_i1.p2 TRINITY_DN3216_c1_g3~~TRINITY_DN3216_c1_g3_i1.p2  ORF type:complete len:150 (+),score=76.30 TRINITY_DN3216_c1_g3_i1:66-515(+)
MFRALTRTAAVQARHFSASRVVQMPVFFTKTHEWVNIEGTEATMGITQFAQEELGEVVYIELPEVGDDVAEGEEYGTVESVKATALLVSPVTGVVSERNDELLDNTVLVNESPEIKAWTLKVKDVKEPTEPLMDRTQYDEYLANEAADN